MGNNNSKNIINMNKNEINIINKLDYIKNKLENYIIFTQFNDINFYRFILFATLYSNQYDDIIDNYIENNICYDVLFSHNIIAILNIIIRCINNNFCFFSKDIKIINLLFDFIKNNKTLYDNIVSIYINIKKN
jgi:hypothetical protein